MRRIGAQTMVCAIKLVETFAQNRSSAAIQMIAQLFQ